MKSKIGGKDMSKLTFANFAKNKFAKIIVGAITAVVATTMFAGNALAWGPNRPTFTMAAPSPAVTFNSITDNTQWISTGDERDFTVIKDVSSANPTCQPNYAGSVASASGFANTATASNGGCYMVKMFVHNNAAPNLNLIAKNVRAHASLPTYSTTNATDSTNNIGIQGIVSADNCGITSNSQAGAACSFWDEAYLTGASSFSASYIQGSTQYFNNVKNFSTNGFSLGDNLIASSGGPGAGDQLGYNQMDGNLQGCLQYSGYVTFLVQTTSATPSFTFSKQVRVAPANGSLTGWSGVGTTLTANPGDTVQYALTFANTGNTQIGDANNGVIVQDYMDGNLAYVNSSSFLINSTYPTGNKLQDNWLGTNMIPGNGQNIGYYAAGANAGVVFSAKVPSADQLLCGQNVLNNVAMVFTPSNGSQLSNATITVNNNCANPCPTNPSVPADNIACKPCPTNPNVSITDAKCQPPVCAAGTVNVGKPVPAGQTEAVFCNPCPTNPNIAATDAKCVKAPATGFAVVSIASLLAFLATVVVLLMIISRKRTSTQK
jgi:uncharacterized repeat protein (TIGR01451 family)